MRGDRGPEKGLRRQEAVDVPDSNFASEVLTKACEPAYNYAGIECLSAKDSVVPLGSLLLFYVGYTAWYGFSILFVFEGLGIVARRGKKRQG